MEHVINFEDHLSQEEMKEIARDTFRALCEKAWNEDHERLIGNAGHYLAQDIVSDRIDGDLSEVIAAQTLEVIEDLSAYTVFGGPSAWDKKESEGFKALKAAVRKHNEAIEKRVGALVKQISKRDALDVITNCSELTIKR